MIKIQKCEWIPKMLQKRLKQKCVGASDDDASPDL